ncbi:hypothetical protein K3556_16035 (plasmid) [Aliiroseovarius sp. M344]|uniref:hypothetical protein n=1 Tax=Aliiroseovarius sp. M344 TaxID=2867010 RepID=UPI0021AD7891|nr:hypothetical protein [Aliiroseovarius sp. M344]UWQ16086.1 hypothetical protein K3556_16035 [Aliiroseovarius sp. M344]
MENEELNDAAFKPLIRRLDNIERKMADKSDVISAVQMVHVFTALTVAETVVVLDALVGFG